MMMLAINPQRIRPDDPDPILPIAMRVVGSDYFNTLRVPILKGRPFDASDRDGSDSGRGDQHPAGQAALAGSGSAG